MIPGRGRSRALIFLRNFRERRKRMSVNQRQPDGTLKKIAGLGQYDVPIEKICAIINTESSFNPKAKSTANAIGIMQITEETFLWLQFKSNEEHKIDELYDYDTNIKYGTYFLSLLYEEFQDWDTVFAAYNAGRGRVNSWLSDSNYSKDGKLINIPFEETANYITKVNKASQKYINLYFTDKSE